MLDYGKAEDMIEPTIQKVRNYWEANYKSLEPPEALNLGHIKDPAQRFLVKKTAIAMIREEFDDFIQVGREAALSEDEVLTF
jgi:hypothetical protein